MRYFGLCSAGQGALTQDLEEYGKDLSRRSDLEWNARFLPSFAACGLAAATENGVTAAVLGEILVRNSNGGHWQHPHDPARSVLDLFLRLHDAALEHVAGPFVLMLADRRSDRLLVAVDRMGIEHVTYAMVDDVLVFSDSAEAVARAPGRAVSLAPDALLDYMVLHMVPAPRTIFSGVDKLRPGHLAESSANGLKQRRYWPAGPLWSRSSRGAAELTGELHQSLRRAVRDCEPDDRTGAFLSGGLDSSTVAGVLSKVRPNPAHTFTIGFGYPEYDELPYSRAANEHFNCTAHEYVVDGHDIAEGFPKIAQAYDEPFGNSSALPVYLCAKSAADAGMTHLLAGDGGDELFAGNTRYVEQQVFERYGKVPKFIRDGLIEPFLRAWPRKMDFVVTRKARGYVEKANVPLPARLEMWNIFHRVGTSNILQEEFRSTLDEESTQQNMQAVWDAAPTEGTLGRMLYFDWQYTLSDNDLRKVQTMSALAGIRVSYPMLHPDVVDVSTRIPLDQLMPGGVLRGFYKKAMTGFLPDKIIHKKKHGFGLPFGLWLQQSPRLKDQIHSNLLALRSRRILRADFIDSLLQLHDREDARYYGVFIWVLAMLEQWMTEHRVSI